MATDVSQLDPQKIWEPFSKADRLAGHYDKKTDVLMIWRADCNDRPGVSVDIDGQFWLRLDPETHEVIGFEIEDFVSVFLHKNPELDRVWREAGARRFIRKRSPERKQSTLRLILERLRELFASSPKMRFA